MKTFTYVAAIALLTAGTAFAQSNAANGSTINNSTPTPSATGPADSAGTSSTTHSRTMNQSGSMNQSDSMNQSGSMDMNKSGSMDKSSSMNQSSNMSQPNGTASNGASMNSNMKSHHVAGNSRADTRENQETMRLNRQQLASNSAGIAPSGMSGASGMSSSSGAGYPFNNGSPQQAQAGGANCTPDNPSCGTARENPAINSSPQKRIYGTQEQ